MSELRSGGDELRSQSKLKRWDNPICGGATFVAEFPLVLGGDGFATPRLYPKAFSGASGTQQAFPWVSGVGHSQGVPSAGKNYGL
jgi:hypothetical protein